MVFTIRAHNNILITFFLTTFMLLFGNGLYAQWPALSTPNVQVTASITTGGKVKDYWACTDGNGGSFSIFSDDRQGNESIYCQRIDKNGSVKFTASGIAVCALSTSKAKKAICTQDGFGNVIAGWEDERGADDNIYVQKVDSLGAVQWTTNGVLICNATDDQKEVWLVPDDSGGVIIAWEDKRNGDEDIYAQRVDSNGVVKWTSNGVVISNATDKQKNLHMVEDGSGGAIITWVDERNTDKDIYAQRINALGVVQWTANGVLICNATDDQDKPVVASDGSQGGIIAWSDKRDDGTTKKDIYCQRINSTGTVQWTANGVALCTSADNQDRPRIIGDQNNGAVISWDDKRTGTEDIYAQRVNSSGAIQWASDGIVVSTATDKQKETFISQGGGGRTLIVWEDKRSGTEDIYIQVLELNGDIVLAANGLAVCTATDKQSKPFIFRNGDTDWITIWKDDRNTATGETDLYAQGLNPTIIPALPIVLLSFDAQLKDNFVELSWSTASEINNDYFTVERLEDVTSWKPAIYISGAGNSRQELHYKAIDESPMSGISYYRLKQTDYDGKFSYSHIEAVNKEGVLIEEIYPQPATDILILSLKEKAKSLSISNLQGKLVYSENNLHEKVLNVDVSNFISGFYFITVQFETGSKSFKILVSK